MKHSRSASLEVRYAIIHRTNADVEKQNPGTTNQDLQTPPVKKAKPSSDDAPNRVSSPSPSRTNDQVLYTASCPGCGDCMLLDPVFDAMQKAMCACRLNYTCTRCNKSSKENLLSVPQCSSNPGAESLQAVSGAKDGYRCIKCDMIVTKEDGRHHVM